MTLDNSRPVTEVCLVQSENVAKMVLANDDDVIKTFPSNRADQPLRIE
jgi:hypothetical protein